MRRLARPGGARRPAVRDPLVILSALRDAHARHGAAGLAAKLAAVLRAGGPGGVVAAAASRVRAARGEAPTAEPEGPGAAAERLDTLLGGGEPASLGGLRWPDALLVSLVGAELARGPAGARDVGEPGRFGYCVIGPAVLCFLAWVARRARADGIEALEFLAREGWVLKDAWERLASHPRVAARLPSARYLLASRRAAVVAAMRDVDDGRRLLRAPFDGPLAQVLEARFGLATAAVRTRLGAAACAARVRLPREASRARAALRACADVALAAARTEREAYRAYLGDRLGPRTAVVDVGWSATIQDALARVVDRPLRGYYFATTRAARALAARGGAVAACFGEDADAAARAPAVHRYGLVLEAVLTSPEGQLTRFVRRGAGVVAERRPPGRAQRAFAELSAIHAGIHRLVRDALDRAGDALLEDGLDPALAQAPLALVGAGRWSAAALRPVLSVEDDFSGRGEVSALDG